MFSTRTNRIARRGALPGLLMVAALTLTACGSGVQGQGQGSSGGNGPARVDADGTTRLNGGDLSTRLDALPIGELTEAEQAGLVQMREEEKLAHDVYVALGEQWDLRTFDNIAAAETTHADAVAALLDRYELDDPAAGNDAGVFTSPDLQALYDGLVAQGSDSLVAALTVGATIEDLDIADLQALATTTPDLDLVYANLERGSRNHLRAFTKQLDKNGAVYSPIYISQPEYDEIIAGPTERGSAG